MSSRVKEMDSGEALSIIPVVETTTCCIGVKKEKKE